MYPAGTQKLAEWGEPTYQTPTPCAMSIPPATPVCFPDSSTGGRIDAGSDPFAEANSSPRLALEPWVSFPRDEALMTAGLDAWTAHAKRQCPPDWLIREERLEARLGVSHLRLPPDHRDPGVGVQLPNQDVPFVRFPRWHYCHFCGGMEGSRFSAIASDAERLRGQTAIACSGRATVADPVRFVTAPSQRHIRIFLSDGSSRQAAGPSVSCGCCRPVVSRTDRYQDHMYVWPEPESGRYFRF